MPTTNPAFDVAGEIRAMLGRRNRSRQWLCRQTGISSARLSRRLAGKSSFTVDELNAVAAALNVSIAQLLGEGAA